MKQVEATIKEGEAQIGERFEELNLELTARLQRKKERLQVQYVSHPFLSINGEIN